MAWRCLGRRLPQMKLSANRLLAFHGLSTCARLSAVPPAFSRAVPHLSRSLTIERSFAASAVASQDEDKGLLSAIDSEIKYERENNNISADDTDPPGDWILSEEPGNSIITLTRRYKGEELLVEFSIDNQSPPGADELPAEELVAADDEEQEPQIDLAINFDVSVIKGNKALTFELSSDGSYVEINHVSIGSSKEEPHADDYDGPVYEELDEQVQAQFQEYLEARGINGELGEYLLAIADNKEQREYLKWLGEVKEFVTS